MTEFIMTPTNIDYLQSIIRNPMTGRWTLPNLTFNINYSNPYYNEIDVLNDDPRYQEKIIDHFYFRLTEKWLFKDAIFNSLLKYFNADTSGTEGKISIISNPDQKNYSDINLKFKKYIFKFIEKYFITKHFVDKVLRQYIKNTHLKWYDLFNNIDNIKNLFNHKLKRLIVKTIYQIQDKN